MYGSKSCCSWHALPDSVSGLDFSNHVCTCMASLCIPTRLPSPSSFPGRVHAFQLCCHANPNFTFASLHLWFPKTLQFCIANIQGSVSPIPQDHSPAQRSLIAWVCSPCCRASERHLTCCFPKKNLAGFPVRLCWSNCLAYIQKLVVTLH